jgi:hypothetical protein
MKLKIKTNQPKVETDIKIITPIEVDCSGMGLMLCKSKDRGINSFVIPKKTDSSRQQICFEKTNEGFIITVDLGYNVCFDYIQLYDIENGMEIFRVISTVRSLSSGYFMFIPNIIIS